MKPGKIITYLGVFGVIFFYLIDLYERGMAAAFTNTEMVLMSFIVSLLGLITLLEERTKEALCA